MILILLVLVALAILSSFVGFVILELHPKWRRSPGNVLKFTLGAMLCAGAAWAGLYFLSDRGSNVFDGVMDVVVLFTSMLLGITGGGTLAIILLGRHR
ncbi:MAG: hypothetical protein IT233_11255 [Bacteroidia bacterium]|nr:hypothetical protein [Bacteroidia bacterium]